MKISIALGWLSPSTLQEMLEDVMHVQDSADTEMEKIESEELILILKQAINDS